MCPNLSAVVIGLALPVLLDLSDHAPGNFQRDPRVRRVWGATERVYLGRASLVIFTAEATPWMYLLAEDKIQYCTREAQAGQLAKVLDRLTGKSPPRKIVLVECAGRRPRSRS